MPIFMKYPGIDGGVTETAHNKWIDLESCQMGTHRNIGATRSGSTVDREASAPTISEIVITKSNDPSSLKLFQNSLSSQAKTVKIDFCRTDKDKLVPYLQLELENTLISSFSVSGSGGDTHSRPMESLSLNFTKITYHNIPTDPGQKAQATDRYSWDTTTNKGA